MVHRVPRALEVHGDDGVEVGFRHREDHLVAQDACVVHEHVESSERLDCRVDDVVRRRVVGHVVVVGDGLTTATLDDVDDGLGGALVGPFSADRTAEVVHHDLRSVVGQHDRLAPPDAVAGAGDDRHFAVENPHLHALQLQEI